MSTVGVSTPVSSFVNKERIEKLVAQRKLLSQQRKSAGGVDGITATKRRATSGGEAVPLSLIEAAKLEPALANPSWVSNELERITRVYAPHLLHRRRDMWINSSNRLVWRPPSTRADPATIMTANVYVKPQGSTMTGNAPPVKANVPVSGCPFGTFLEDVADVRWDVCRH